MQWVVGSLQHFANTLLPSRAQHRNCCWAGIIHYGLCTCISKMIIQKIQKNGCFFLCIVVYQIYCVIFSYIPFTFPPTSKNLHILASGPVTGILIWVCFNVLSNAFILKIDVRGHTLLQESRWPSIIMVLHAFHWQA
jgi:hypothetical protein